MVLSPRFAEAHAANPPEGPADLWAAWTLDPIVLVGFVAIVAGYALGVGKLWRRAGAGRGIAPSGVASFTAGMAAFSVAMVWPLDALGEILFSAHMAQHIVLTAVVPPLLWLGRPVILLWSVPRQLRSHVGAWLRIRPVRTLWTWMTLPLPAFLLEGAILWGWHAPGAIAAALENEAVHAAMHLSFLVGGLLFWHALAHAGRRRGTGYAETAALSFLTMMHTGLLGALLTFTPRPLYLAYGDSPLAWGLTPLEDQQIAGIIMWVICGTIYIVAGVLLLAAWLGQIERQNVSAPSFLSEYESARPALRLARSDVRPYPKSEPG
ncbi:MAG: hypothetical protein CMP81_06295 [Fulvimarina sp.]|nr:hypothetical protein [Fulvimarina sp.]